MLYLSFQNKKAAFISTFPRIIKNNATLMNHTNTNCSIENDVKTRTTQVGISNHFSVFLISNAKKLTGATNIL